MEHPKKDSDLEDSRTLTLHFAEALVVQVAMYPTPNTLRYAHTPNKSDITRPTRLISVYNIKKRPIVSQFIGLGT